MAKREVEGVALVLISPPGNHTIGTLPRRGDQLLGIRGRGLPPSPGQERGRQGRLATYPTYTKLKVLHQDGLAGTPAARPAMQKTEHVVCKTAAPPPTRVATRGYPDLEDGHREKSRKREELVPRK